MKTLLNTMGYANTSAHTSLKPMSIERKDPVGNEVQIEILYCGVCHSDVHQARNEWKNTVYPCMPGHEIVGRVSSVGASCRQYSIGDIVGVGCIIQSCRACAACKEGLEQYCEKGFTLTYNGNMRFPSKENLTFGGYSEQITVNENYVLKIPATLDPAAAAPILCAGITTYSPMKHWKVGPGKKVAVVGMGGLGQMAIKLAKALGADVTGVTTSSEKTANAKKRGAREVIDSTDKDAMKRHANSFDFILSTIPQAHDANPYLSLVKRDGILAIVGCLVPLKEPLDLSQLNPDRKSLGTSLIGGIAETQEVLNFCAEHSIVSDIKIIPIDHINDAFDQIDKGEIDFRYVIDMKSLQGKTESESLLDKIGL